VTGSKSITNSLAGFCMVFAVHKFLQCLFYSDLHQKNTKIPTVSLHGSTVSPCSHDGGRFPRPAIPSTTWAVWRSAQAGNARVGGTGNPVGVAVTIGDWQTDKLEILGTRR